MLKVVTRSLCSLLVLAKLSYASPTMQSVTPNSGLQGATLNLTLTGSGFQPDTSVLFSGSGVIVNGVQVLDSTTILANVTLLGETGIRTISLSGSPATSGLSFEILPSPLSNPQPAVVTTLAGPGNITGTADGRGSDARFQSVRAVWFDGSNLYVIDLYRIRRIAIATGEVTTLAGSTEYDSNRRDGVGENARFLFPASLWGDGTNLYIAEGNVIRKLVITTRQVSTLSALSFSFAGARLWGDSESLYVLDLGTAVEPRIIPTDASNFRVITSLWATALISISETFVR